MLMRVATFAQNNQMINSAMRTEAVMANEQEQEASGQQSQDIAGYGANAGQVLNLQVSVTQAQSYINAATSATSQVQVMYSAVGSMTDLMEQLKSELTATTTGTSTTTAAVVSDAQQMLGQMGSLLNTQYAGNYVFGGADTSTAPVDLTNFSTGTGSLSTADTSYYQGDDQVASVQVSSSQSVSFGVTADNSAFEQVMRVLKYVGNSTSLSPTDLSQALTLATNALSATATVQAQLSTASSEIQTASSEQTDYQNFATTLSGDLTNVDVAAVTAQLSTYQTQLEASFAAIAKIQSLSLTSYLK
jgi:flagellar hook-associated protein 3 FlgL